MILYWLLLFAWPASLIILTVCAFKTKQGEPFHELRTRRLNLLIGAALPSLATLITVFCIFYEGRASNIAQLKSAGDHGLWAGWLFLWLAFLLINPLSLLFALSGALMPPYKQQGMAFQVAKVASVLAAGFACIVLALLQPDA